MSECPSRRTVTQFGNISILSDTPLLALTRPSSPRWAGRGNGRARWLGSIDREKLGRRPAFTPHFGPTNPILNCQKLMRFFRDRVFAPITKIVLKIYVKLRNLCYCANVVMFFDILQETEGSGILGRRGTERRHQKLKAGLRCAAQIKNLRDRSQNQSKPVEGTAESWE
jgi:hypothetical protein